MSARRVVRMISTPLALIILLGALGYGLYWGFKTVTEPIPPAPGTPCVTVTMPELTTSSVTVNVYNGGNLRGKANEIAKAMRAGGYVVAKVNNTETPVSGTIIVGATADSPEVLLVAAWFIDPEIQADGRVEHTVDVLVGNQYQGMTEEPPASLTLPSGQVCLPSSETPTPTEEPAGEGEGEVPPPVEPT